MSKSKKARKVKRPVAKKRVSSKKVALKKSLPQKKSKKSTLKSRKIPGSKLAISRPESDIKDTRPAEPIIKFADKLTGPEMRKGTAKAQIIIFDNSTINK